MTVATDQSDSAVYFPWVCVIVFVWRLRHLAKAEVNTFLCSFKESGEMVKRCCWGTCNTDSRYPERLANGVYFVPFPKPATKLDQCREWIRLCGRPKDQLNEQVLRDPSKSKHFYVCSKHFKDGKPSAKYPNPEPALAYDRHTPARPPPKPRHCEEPVRKRTKTCLAEIFEFTVDVIQSYSYIAA